MKRVTVISGIFLVALLGLLFPACAPKESAQPQQHPIVELEAWSGKMGTGAYIVGFNFGEVLNKKHPWLRMSVVETPGGLAAMNTMLQNPDKLTKLLGTGSPGSLNELKTQNKDKVELINGFRNLFSYTIAGPTIFITFDSKLRKPEDLVGKKIGLGTKSQTIAGIAATATLKTWGILDKAKVEYMGTDQAAKALIDGAVDAFVVYGYISPTTKFQAYVPLQTVLGTGRPVYIIGSTKEVAQKTLEATGPGPTTVMLPKGAIPGMESDVWGVGEPTSTTIVDKSFPEDVAYELTVFALENYKDVQAVGAVAETFNPSCFPYGMVDITHPGAKRAYLDWAKKNPNDVALATWREQGLIK